MGQSLTDTQREKLDKIARMRLHEVPLSEIAAIVGISESRISQICATEQYQEIYSKLAYEIVEQYNTLNDGWDSVEALALDCVVKHLEWQKDPDFALRAATMANRANRRGRFNNVPLQGRTDVRAVINLSAKFVQKFEQHFTPQPNVPRNLNGNPDKKIDMLPRKASDVLTPDAVEKLFEPDEHNEEQAIFNVLAHSFVPAE